MSNEKAVSIEEWVLGTLACPACDSRPPVTQTVDGLHCSLCGRTYPIQDGIPIMLVDKASQTPGGN